MEQHRVEVAVGPGGDAPGHGVGELIGGPRHEGVEGVAFLQARRAGGLGDPLWSLDGDGSQQRFDGFRRAAVDGGEPQSRAAAGGFHLDPGLQIEATTIRIERGPDLGDAAPGVAPDPVRREARGRDEHQRAARLLQEGGLRHPGTEGRLAQLAPQRGASLGPHDSGR